LRPNPEWTFEQYLAESTKFWDAAPTSQHIAEFRADYREWMSIHFIYLASQECLRAKKERIQHAMKVKAAEIAVLEAFSA
jgi:hypothetical protein